MVGQLKRNVSVVVGDVMQLSRIQTSQVRLIGMGMG